MSLDVLRACIQGYMDRIFDQQLLSVQTGYWAGYYQRAKRPLALKAVISKILRKKNMDTAKTKQKHSGDVDVEGFLAMEARFKERFNKLK